MRDTDMSQIYMNILLIDIEIILLDFETPLTDFKIILTHTEIVLMDSEILLSNIDLLWIIIRISLNDIGGYQNTWRRDRFYSFQHQVSSLALFSSVLHSLTMFFICSGVLCISKLREKLYRIPMKNSHLRQSDRSSTVWPCKNPDLPFMV